MRIATSRHKANHMELIKQQGKNSFKVKKDKPVEKEQMMETIINKLNISEDVINGAEIITLIGKRNLVIENYIKVIVCETEKIIVKTKRNYVLIEGNNLKIEYIYDVEIRITGKIDCICLKNNITY